MTRRPSADFYHLGCRIRIELRVTEARLLLHISPVGGEITNQNRVNDIYILVSDQESGPFDLQDLVAMVEQGEISPDTLYARPGMESWEQISKIVSGPSSANNGAEWANDATDLDGPLPGYNVEGFRSLMHEFKSLSSYLEVNQWDHRASAEVQTIVATLRDIDAAVKVHSRAVASAKQDFEAQSFIKRTFGGRDRENAIAQRLSTLQKRKIDLLRFVAELQGAIDFTPNTPEERETLVKELRLRKKELQTRKREAAITMTSIRKEARIESAHAGKSWLGIYDRDLASYQRRHIRYAKEAALKPHEDVKGAIERQLIEVDKDLLWVERFE